MRDADAGVAEFGLATVDGLGTVLYEREALAALFRTVWRRFPNQLSCSQMGSATGESLIGRVLWFGRNAACRFRRARAGSPEKPHYHGFAAFTIPGCFLGVDTDGGPTVEQGELAW